MIACSIAGVGVEVVVVDELLLLVLLLLLLVPPVAALLHLRWAVATHPELVCLADSGHVLVGERRQSANLVDIRVDGGDVRRHQEVVLEAVELAARCHVPTHAPSS